MLEKLFGLKPDPPISLGDYCLAAAFTQQGCDDFRHWLALADLDSKMMTATKWSRYHDQYLALLGGLAGQLDSER